MNKPIESSLASSKQSIFIYALIILTVLVSWLTQKPGDNAYIADETTQFSQIRALGLLKEISEYPHYTSSKNIADVRTTIVEELEKMGLDVSVQNTMATSSKRFRSNQVSNIVGVLPATTNQGSKRKALALVSHYDSREHSSLGASDAGSGVVTTLETLRAYIETKEQRQNDIIVIITDAEEQGLMGAEAFVKEHSLTQNIGLVLNFEARGSGGPSYMFMETNQGNKALIAAFKDAGVDYPQTNSLMYSIYKMLPNDTDLTIFKEQADIQGFNFAFIDDHYDYHTIQDSFERLDHSTLNHQASYLTALLPLFANIELDALRNDVDHVYFNVANWGIVDYPFTWVMPMVILATLIFIGYTILGIRRNQLIVKQLFLGFIPALGSLLVIALVSIYGWQLATFIFPYLTEMPHGFTYNGHWIIAFGIFLSLIITMTVYRWFKSRFNSVSSIELLIAPIIIWLTINALCAIYLTGAGFFIIALIAPLIMLILCIHNANGYRNLLWVVAPFIGLSLLVIGPQLPVFVIGLGLSNLVIATILTSLLFIVAMPLLMQLRGLKVLSNALVVGLFISIVGIVVKSGYDVDHKKPNNINYLYDTQTNKAYLFSYTKHLDAFTRQFFSEEDTDLEGLKEIYPISRWRLPYFVKPTAAINLKPAIYTANLNPVIGQKSLYQFDITLGPNRTINMFQIMSNIPLVIHRMEVEGKQLADEGRRTRRGVIFRHLITNESSIKLSMQFESASLPEFRLLGTSFDLAEQFEGFKPRADAYMPSPYRLSDAVIISQPIGISETSKP